MSVGQIITWLPASIARWVKSLFTRDALADGAKTAVWVVPLTILIWIYAEQQQRTDEKEQPVLINVRSSDPDRIVTVHRGDDVPVIAMSGPRASIESVKDQLNKQGDNRLITIDVPRRQGLGSVSVDIAQQIARAQIFVKNGIDVSSVRPSSIQVQVDSLETRELEVQPSATDHLDTATVPTFEPKTVKVKAPSSVFNDALTKNGGKPLVAYAQIPTMGDNAKPGIHPDVPLQVMLPFEGDNITLLSSSTVTATYGIKASFVTDEVPSLLIQTMYVGQTANTTVVDAPQIVKVKIVGPKDQVDRVKARSENNESPLPYAILKIDPGDIPSAPGVTKNVTKTLDYVLTEPDVHVDDKSKYTVEVKIRRREAPAPS